MRSCFRLASLVLAASMTACGGSEPPIFEKLAKSIENLQCEPAKFTRAQVEAELANAGIAVNSQSCAGELIGHVAACGTPESYLNVIVVYQEQAAAARALGYQSLSSFTNVVPIDCPLQ